MSVGPYALNVIEAVTHMQAAISSVHIKITNAVHSATDSLCVPP